MNKMKEPEMVDLGLSVKWAKWNVGATKETEYGKLFAWGDTIGSDATKNGCEGKYDTMFYIKQGLNAIKSDLASDQDAATVAYGGDYRMPTKKECDELVKNTTYSKVKINGVIGGKFTAKNGNYIFFPFTGYGYYGSICFQGNSTRIWSSSYPTGSDAWHISCRDNIYEVFDRSRHYGFSVRAVCK